MEFTLPLPQQLDRNGVLLRQWTNFSQRFHSHQTNLSFDHSSEAESILLFSAQHHLNSIIESLRKYNLDAFKLSKILEAVEQVCLPYFLLLFERFRYFTLEQDTSDTMSEFVNVMRKQIDLCEFGDTKDSIMTNTVVSGVAGENFRQTFQDAGRLQYDNTTMDFFSGASCRNITTSISDSRVTSRNTSLPNEVVSNSAPEMPILMPSITQESSMIYNMNRKLTDTTSGNFAVVSRKKKSYISTASTKANIILIPFNKKCLEEDFVAQSQAVKSHKSKDKKLQNTKLENKFGSQQILARPSLFLCFSCDCEYSSRKSFYRHLQSKHIDCNEYYCKHCAVNFPNRRECVNHCMGHTALPSAQSKILQNTEYLCWYCEEIVPDLEDYKKHCSTHSAIRVFYCDLCQRKTHTLQRMIGHLKGHLIPRYRCEICANCFGREELFVAHLETHAAQPVHQCQMCSKNFVSADRLQGHMRTHNEEKRFMCELCGKSYRQKISLECHKRAHAGEKPYKCEVCGNNFTTFKHLKEHKQMHSDKRPYVCEVCGKSFRFSSNLTRHRNGHTGKRAFGCEICGKTFIYSEGLRDHRKAGRCPGRKHDGIIKRRPRTPRTKTASSSVEIANDNDSHITSNYPDSHVASNFTVDRLFSDYMISHYMFKK